jgi:hypothetical protein
VLPDQAQRLRTVDAGQLKIHQDEVGVAVHCELDSVLARSCFDDIKSRVRQYIAHELEIQLVVFDDQYAMVAHRLIDPFRSAMPPLFAM